MNAGLSRLLLHLTAYAAPHLLAAAVLAAIEFVTFAPGGESASGLEAATLQLFVSTVLLVCSIAGYLAAVAFVAPRLATQRLSWVLAVIAGTTTLGVAGFGLLDQFVRNSRLSVFVAAGILGFAAGIVVVLLVALKDAGSRRFAS